jgi:hypothetical protein
VGCLWIEVGAAVDLLIASGLSEHDARPRLIEAIGDGAVKSRGPPLWVMEIDAIDWQASMVCPIVFAPDRAIVARSPREPIRVSCDDVMALCRLLRDLRSSDRTSARAGRKPGGRTKGPAIIEAFLAMCDRDQVSFRRGGLTEAARQLKAQFPDYSVDRIMKIIKPEFDLRAR